jgi:ABC-type glutathione transport system ATPase component
MREVLRPYVNGLAARLNALQSVQELIQSFVEGINGFLTNKHILFDLSSGVRIALRNGDDLLPEMLSSGEKQLLLLFCNTITARRQGSIFIVDEPEISLNVEWQRKLLRSLLNLVRGSEVQFVAATHSIELLTQYRQHVLQLESRPIRARKA